MTLPPYDGPLQRPRQAETTTLAQEEAAPGAGGGGEAGRPSPGAGAGGWAPSREPEPGARAAAQPPAPPPRPAPAVGDPEPLNLARRPFINARPVARVAAILWLLGLALLAANLMLFLGYLTKSQTSRAKLAELERETDREKLAVTKLQGGIGSLGLDQQNREVAFLNRKIDERTFSWSLLFDRMAEVLPQRVRLLQLRPSNVVQKDTGAALLRPVGRDRPVPVTLTMSCEAKDDEAVLRFVDNLFAHPAFAEPNLAREDRDESGLVRFEVTSQYQPNLPAAQAAETGPAARRARAAAPGAAATPGAAAPSAGSGGELGAPAPRSPAGAGLVRVTPPPRRRGDRP